jgi:hypothetical protein
VRSTSGDMLRRPVGSWTYLSWSGLSAPRKSELDFVHFMGKHTARSFLEAPLPRWETITSKAGVRFEKEGVGDEHPPPTTYRWA